MRPRSMPSTTMPVFGCGTVLARLPANRTKLYGDLPIDQAIARADKEGKPLLAPVTQERYLAALRDILDLAAKKQLIAVNPADGLKPIKRDAVAASRQAKIVYAPADRRFLQKRLLRRMRQAHAGRMRTTSRGGDFGCPCSACSLGTRPNEIAQMHVADLKRTQNGTWYLDIEATADEDEDSNGAAKTLKTATSRRKIPLHPELHQDRLSAIRRAAQEIGRRLPASSRT